MKKFKWILFLLPCILVLPLFLTSCGKEEQKISSYSLDLIYDESSHVLSGKEEVEFFNNSENLIEELHFNLFPNAFREESKRKVVSVDKKDEAYPKGMSYGDIQIDNVECNIDDTFSHLDFEVGGEDENILIVNLENGIYPDESVKIVLTFKVTLANINHRLGYGENVINFGNFYPILCVYEDGKGFNHKLYHSNGDPFYSDIANYTVSITYPNTLTLATSGKVTNEIEQSGKKVSKIDAFKVRDFAFCLSNNFNQIEKMVGNTLVKYFGYQDDEDLNNCLETSVKALNYFNSKFGHYPYSTLSIVKTNFIHGGMEYPTLVMISDQCESQDEKDYVIVHEIAHQWWYGMVGNDEYDNAWMDESLAEYSTLLYFEDNKSQSNDYQTLVKNATSNYKFFVEIYTKVLGNVDTSMNRPLDKFETEPEYVNCVYTKGIVMYHTIREMVGDKKFDKALKQYFQEYCYKNAKVEDLIASFSKSTGHNLEGFFMSWLDGSVVVM